MRASRFRRRTTIGVAAALLAWPLAFSTAWASTGIVPGPDRAAAVQAVLDRVLGPGNSTVVVADTVQTSTTAVSQVRWGSGVAASVTVDRVTTPNGTISSTAQQNGVGSTVTDTLTPAGALVRQSVSIAVDRAHLGRTSLATLRRLVGPVVGFVGSRGDRISIVVASFAHPVPVRAVAPSPITLLAPYAVPALWASGAIGVLLILARALRGGRRPRAAGTDLTRA